MEIITLNFVSLLGYKILCLVTGYKNFFDQKKIKKMNLLVQCSVVESFKFNGEKIRTVHVPGLGRYLVGIDVSIAIGYVDDNNDRRAIKRHVPQKYMMWYEDVKDIAKRHVRLDVPQDDAILLKEPVFIVSF